MNIYRRLFQLTRPVSGWMLLAALAGGATIICGVGLLATSTYLISVAALHPQISTLAIPLVAVRFFGVARAAFRYLERLLSHQATFGLLANLRSTVYEKLEPLLPAYLHTAKHDVEHTKSSGDILQRMVADIETLQHFYVRVVAPPAVAVLIGGLLWWFLLQYPQADRGLEVIHSIPQPATIQGSVYPEQPKMSSDFTSDTFRGSFALIFLVCLLLAGAGIPGLSYALSQRLARRIVLLQASLQANLVAGVQGRADLLAFGQEEWHLARIRHQQGQIGTMQRMMAHISGLQQALSLGCSLICAWLLLLVALPAVHTGALAGTSLALVVLAALAGFECVQSLPAAFQHLGSTRESARRLFEIVDASPSVQDPSISPQSHDSSLEVRNLSFRYAPEEPEVLHDLTLTLPQGRCLALVGPSGVGKSTLVRILLRYWEYHQGSISFGGHELRSYRREDLYRSISVVEQDTTLFNTTLRENLLLARAEATQDELITVLQQAQLYSMVQSLPQGLDTLIGEQGCRLSGGERQRLAIARAFLKDAPFLILDEPTANLDTLNEQALLHALQALCQHRTVLLITHRSSLLEMADTVVHLSCAF